MFVGKERMPLTLPGEKVQLGFGADDRITVARVPVSRRDADNAFGPSRSETQNFRTSVKNLHAFPVRIALIDRSPVSQNTAVVYDYKRGETREVRLG